MIDRALEVLHDSRPTAIPSPPKFTEASRNWNAGKALPRMNWTGTWNGQKLSLNEPAIYAAHACEGH